MAHTSYFGCASVLGIGAGLCSGQQASVVVTHNDPDGVVAPGETVEVRATLSWSGNAHYLQEVRGSLRATPDRGISAHNRFPYSQFASIPLVTIVDPGVAVGGSVLGLHLFTGAQQWIFFGIVAYPWYLHNGIDLVSFEWTAPSQPGVVRFDFLADPLLPEPMFLGPPFTAFPLPTTYLGTSLTVIPAPASASALAAGLWLLGGAGLGRRRGRRLTLH